MTDLKRLKKLSPEYYKMVERIEPVNRSVVTSGKACRNKIEPLPEFNRADCEKVISGKNNTYIVLGRDRPNTKISGYGGSGSEQAGMVDIVVGRMSHNPTGVDQSGSQIVAEPNFTTDASRIYISQKSNIDEYMSLADGRIGSSKARSSIGLKSDEIRIVARRGVKIVTGTDVLDSRGERVDIISGVDIIAGNNEDTLQPMLLGDNVNDLMIDMCDRLLDICSLMRTTKKVYQKYFSEIARHMHISPFFGAPTSPSDALVISGAAASSYNFTLYEQQISSIERNIINIKNNYLKKASNKNIRSSFNNVN